MSEVAVGIEELKAALGEQEFHRLRGEWRTKKKSVARGSSHRAVNSVNPVKKFLPSPLYLRV